MTDPPRLLETALSDQERWLLESAQTERPDDGLSEKMLSPLRFLGPAGLIDPIQSGVGPQQLLQTSSGGPSLVSSGTTAGATTGGAGASLPPAAPLLLGTTTKWLASIVLIGGVGASGLWLTNSALGGRTLGGTAPGETSRERESSLVAAPTTPEGRGSLESTDSTERAASSTGKNTASENAPPEAFGEGIALQGATLGEASAHEGKTTPVKAVSLREQTREQTREKSAKKSVASSSKSTRASTSSPGVAEEIATLEKVRSQINDGNPRAALKLLSEYSLEYPHGTLAPEAQLLSARAQKLLADASNSPRRQLP